MAKKGASLIYICQSCGARYSKWSGKCGSCGQWDSLVEEVVSSRDITVSRIAASVKWQPLKGHDAVVQRLKSGMEELDRTVGGGFVPGSVVLIGGDPGIGKSTLLLQVTAALSNGFTCAYVSGEESISQVRLRAKRLGLDDTAVQLASTNLVEEIISSLPEKLDVLVIDSIQTMTIGLLDSAPGTVGQVRACAYELIKAAKSRNFVLFIVGHVTKEGALAGPRVLEHMVDTVLYFEGDRGHQFRILRSVKNRFGATDEIGVFEMTQLGLEQVKNPSALFLAERRGNISGSCVFAGIEGSRPLLVEIQALVSQSGGLSPPRRAVVGWDNNRLSMVLAVLEARCGLSFGNKDVFLNVAGGLKLTEPAADLAVAAAIISALSGKPVPADCVCFGEIGLSGEVRSVPQPDLRMKEAVKLGFAKALAPPAKDSQKNVAKSVRIAVKDIGNVKSLSALFVGSQG